MTNHIPDRSSVARTSPLVEPIHGQQPFEDGEEFARFQVHLAEGPERTYKGTAAVLGLHPATVAKLGAENRWSLRSAAWDAEIAAVLSKSLLARQIHARVEQADAGRMMRRLGVEALETRQGMAGLIETKDAVSLVTNGAKVESTALGVAEKHELEVTMRDATTMTAEERRAEMKEMRDMLDAKLAELGTTGAGGASDQA